jgi:hypothetical protein
VGKKVTDTTFQLMYSSQPPLPPPTESLEVFSLETVVNLVLALRDENLGQSTEQQNSRSQQYK